MVKDYESVYERFDENDVIADGFVISALKKIKSTISGMGKKLPERKTTIDIAVEQTINKPRIIFKDKVILSLALIVGLSGAVIIYNQMPTHILVVVGIICICFSFSVVTGISRW